MKNSENRTKIVATIGPSTESFEMLNKIVDAGVNVCRINASHGSHSAHKSVIDNVRKINEQRKRNIAILFDLQGPKLRIGEVKDNEIYLEDGDSLKLTIKECIGDNKLITIRYSKFHEDVHAGDTVLIDDGKIELLVTGKDKTDTVTAKVVHGGVLSSKKGINLPYTKISLPCLTDKDKADLDFALDNNVEWIGLSFVRSANDIKELKAIIESKNKNSRVIAKIEKPQAIRNLDEIIQVSDGIMVARGDLGVEVDMEKVPVMQKMIVRKSIKASKPVIIATQMMESMIANYRPTRAETNDVANAVFDGADALMLSGETSVGAYPEKVIEAMHKIISLSETESNIYNRFNPPIKNSSSFISDSVCYNSCVMADQSGAKSIIAMTHSGYTAFRISSQRPGANIFIFTANRAILNTLSLVWGVRAIYYDNYESSDQTINDIRKHLQNNQYVLEGDLVIHVFSMPLEDRGMANTIKLNIV
jgi:pyruvate kinase